MTSWVHQGGNKRSQRHNCARDSRRARSLRTQGTERCLRIALRFGLQRVAPREGTVSSSEDSGHERLAARAIRVGPRGYRYTCRQSASDGLLRTTRASKRRCSVAGRLSVTQRACRTAQTSPDARQRIAMRSLARKAEHCPLNWMKTPAPSEGFHKVHLPTFSQVCKSLSRSYSYADFWRGGRNN